VRVFLGITGASGAVYGARALRELTRAGCEVGLCVSESGAIVIAHELLGLGARPALDRERIVQELVEGHADRGGTVTALGLDELTSPFASGSSRGGSVALIAPCSGSTLGAIAHGAGRNLIHRCADVMLKERRTLVLMPRETPLGAIYLENLLAVQRAGAIVMPAMPGFYSHPATVDDLVAFMVGKALDALGVPHDLLRRWGEDEGGTA
jgi:flavin prenyltransferase